MIGYEIVHIKWVDSEVLNEWTDAKSLKPSFDELHSIGFLIDQGPEGYLVAGMVDPETASINAIQFIPKGCVKKITPLTLLKALVK
jgi:hypothetical protein